MKYASGLSFIIISIFLFSSCPGTGDNSGGVKTDIDQYFWGSWVRMDGVNEGWYISNSRIIIDGEDYSARSSSTSKILYTSSLEIVKKTDNMLTVNPGADEYYLFRKSGATASVTSGVLGDGVSSSLNRSLSGVGGIRVIMQNTANPLNTIDAATDSNGELHFEGVIPKDDYVLTIPEQTGVNDAVDIDVRPEFDGENIGIITLNGADQNFNVSYSLETDDEWGYHYAGESYTLDLTIANIGTADMLSADYRISEPAGLNIFVNDNRLNDILGTIRANGGAAHLSYTIATDIFEDDYRDFVIPIEIFSYDGLYQWQDQVQLRFYREKMGLFVKSDENEVQGIVISPEQRAFPFRTYGLEGGIYIPAREHGYIFALSGADYSSETKYAMQISTPPESNGTSLISSRINEPNNDETLGTAAYLNEEYQGYLGVYDLDFFQIHNIPVDEGFFVTGVGLTNDSTPRWSWNAPSDAIGFRYSLNSEADWNTTNEQYFVPEFELSDGEHSLYVQYEIAADGWSASQVFTVSIDTTPPDTPVLSARSSTTEEYQPPYWSWIGSSDTVCYRYKINNGDFISVSASTTAYYSERVSVGYYTLYLQACDSIGNWSNLVSSRIRVIQSSGSTDPATLD